MSFSNDQSKLLFEKLVKAAAVLERQIGTKPDETHMMSSIQAFEFCFELSWKWLKTELSGQGLDAQHSPRDVFRLAGRTELIESVELWLSFIKQRNLTSHTYESETAEEVYSFIEDSFAPELRRFIAHIQSAE